MERISIKVRRQKPVLVVPSKPTKNESKQMSEIDNQQSLRCQVPVILCFKGDPSKQGEDQVIIIKDALAEALVYFYPLAGRLRQSPNGNLMVDCNGQGVLFVEADADVALNEVEAQILPPCTLLEDLLFDVPGSKGIIGCPLLLFQVARFTCGGFTLAVLFNHTLGDGQGITELCAYVPSTVPVWQRELLTARCPPKAKDKSNEQANKEAKSNMVQGSLYFGPQEMKSISNKLPPHLQNSTSHFEVLCAFIWKCRTISLQPNPEEIVSLSYVVNIRRIISLPLGYYGNAVVFPAVTIKARHLLGENSMAYALELVKEMRGRVNEEFVNSVMDFMVVKGRPMYNASIFLNWMASKVTRVGFEHVDFGWGVPFYCGVPRESYNISFFTRTKNGIGEDVIVVPLCLPIQAMVRFLEELGRMVGSNGVFHSLDVLHPISPYMRSML